MLTSVYYQIIYQKEGKKEFEFISNTNIRWTLVEEWISNETCYIINLSCSDNQLPYVQYYADVEIYTNEKHSLVKTSSKGLWRQIDVRIDVHEFMVGFSKLYHKEVKYSPDLFEKLMDSKKFYCEVKLSPILELVPFSEANADRKRKNKMLKHLLFDIDSLLSNPDFDFLYDVQLASDTTRVNAHKNILSVFLPELCPKMKRRNRQRNDGSLEKIEMNGSVAQSLKKYIDNLYRGEATDDIVNKIQDSLVEKKQQLPS